MGDISGLNGNITLPSGINAKVYEWSADLDIDQAAIPPSFGEAWEGACNGASRLSGSLTAKLAKDAASTQPFTLSTTTQTQFTGVTTLTVDSGCTITGTMNFSKFSIKRPHGGVVELTANFRNASNDVGITWDTSA